MIMKLEVKCWIYWKNIRTTCKRTIEFKFKIQENINIPLEYMNEDFSKNDNKRS